ncbi:MAG TPA: CDP-diacylglycerol--glycerol-3-phosphate 3-phosphatidyltransferase, partial [Pyrinomonadaceae bacterium]|nr:CDP-diacylglycerol--glycerol-3-phosphate 3-phosphatidyltransferase [Pyrinomonadaceae bacterium]
MTILTERAGNVQRAAPASAGGSSVPFLDLPARATYTQRTGEKHEPERLFAALDHGREGGYYSLNLPNALTLSRIFVVPLLVVVLLTPFSENWLGAPRHLVGVALFLAAAFTDFLDGQIARRRDQVSQLGKLLDPIADKLLISAALIALVENRLAPAWAVVIIIGREFAVTGLRSIAATNGVVIGASRMGKFKMLAQVVAIALLIVSSAQGAPPVTNFGKAFPVIQFWTVPELNAAFAHLFGAGRVSGIDWQILLYTAGR